MNTIMLASLPASQPIPQSKQTSACIARDLTNDDVAMTGDTRLGR